MKRNRKKQKAKPRVYVHIRAYWGNGDAESSIKVSRRRWKAIQEGAEYSTGSWSWYEGQRFRVGWHFKNGLLSVYGGDCNWHLEDYPVSKLFAEVVVPE